MAFVHGFRTLGPEVNGHDDEGHGLTTIATVGTPQDITLQELRVECFFPADQATEAVVRRLAG